MAYLNFKGVILISDNCNCGETCVGGLTCHCNDTTTFICPGDNCSIPNNNNNCNCGCDCNLPDCPLPETHRVQRLIAPSRDTHTNWNDKDPVIKEGVLGLTKDRLFNGSLEYFIGDGVHKYSELPKYGGAEASSTKKNNTLVLRNGNGKIDSASLPDATSTNAGAVKASTTTAADNVVKADSNGSLEGWDDAIANAIADPDNGLVVNPQTGKLNVDFDQMPTDKFEALLKSLKMLIPLSSNMTGSNALFVDTNSSAAGDTIIDGRGTEAKPFKTIQAAVNFATSTYSVGSHTIAIRVKAGTYNEQVTLPEYSYGSGIIEIVTYSGNQDVIVEAPLNSAGTRLTCVSATGGKWRLRNIEAKRVENPTTQTGGASAGCFGATGSSTFLYLVGCKATQLLPSNPSGLSTSQTYYCRIINADQGAQIRLYPSENQATITATKNSGTTPYVSVLSALRGANITFVATTDTSLENEIACSGSCDYFLYLSSRSVVNGLGGGNQIGFTGTVTGQKYDISGGSCTNVTNGDTDFFPGDSAGSVESATYCFYA